MARVLQMKLLGLDPGYTNIGICFLEIDTDFNILQDTIFVKKVDLTNLPPCEPECRLRHSTHIVDRISHMFKRYEPYFEDADLILLEFQCPHSAGCSFENLVYFKYGHKTQLVYPHELHTHYKTRGITYDERKAVTVEIVSPTLALCANFKNMVRKHDVSDATLFIMYYCEKQKSRRAIESQPKIRTDLSRFMYVKK